MKARFLMTLVILVTMLTPVMVHATDLVITSYTDNGVVQWTYPIAGLEGYRIEWAPNLASGKWTDLEQGMRYLAPTGANMAAEVPMFYRIRAMTSSPPNMVYIPPGTFRMGDTFAEGDTNELPVHNVSSAASIWTATR